MTIIFTSILDFALSCIKSLAKIIGWGGVVAIGLLTYFEGVPYAGSLKIHDSVPIIGGFGFVDIPIIGPMAAGRLTTYANEQVMLATSVMVSKAELDAANAVADRERDLREKEQRITASAQKRADDLQLAVVSQAQQIKDLTESAKGLPTWTDAEMQWYKQHSR